MDISNLLVSGLQLYDMAYFNDTLQKELYYQIDFSYYCVRIIQILLVVEFALD